MALLDLLDILHEQNEYRGETNGVDVIPIDSSNKSIGSQESDSASEKPINSTGKEAVAEEEKP